MFKKYSRLKSKAGSFLSLCNSIRRAERDQQCKSLTICKLGSISCPMLFPLNTRQLIFPQSWRTEMLLQLQNIWKGLNSIPVLFCLKALSWWLTALRLLEACLYLSSRVFQLMEKVFMEAPKKQREEKPFLPWSQISSQPADIASPASSHRTYLRTSHKRSTMVSSWYKRKIYLSSSS